MNYLILSLISVASILPLTAFLMILMLLTLTPRSFVVHGAVLSEPETIPAIITAYSSEESQTDSSPTIMASGKTVYKGAVANNCYPFGTKVEINGKVYIVEDRKNKRYSCEWWDIYFEDTKSALEWGIQEHEIIVYK